MPTLNFTKSKLRVLSVTENKIKTVSILSAQLSDCDSMEELAIHKNALVGELDLPPLPSLIKLLARENKLMSLKKSLLNGFPNLATLDLEKNAIGVLDFDIPGTIGSLKLKENVIRKISVGSFANLNTSSSLDLSKNKIKVIEDGAFEGMESLTKLNLEDNELSYIPDMTDITDTLETLDLDKNWFNISDLQNLDQFQSLIKINLAHCGLNGSSNTAPSAKFDGNLFAV